MLQQALSDFTLKWIHNKGFTAENLEDADFLINQLECYIKGTTNPLVQITQLFSLKHDPAQSIESFVTEIKERCRLCEFDKVKSIDNWIPMIVLCCNVAHPDMRKKLLLEKDLTFERAVEICLEEEKALRTSKQLAKSGGDVCVTTANATSAYSQNRSQHQQRQHQQNHGGGQERGRSASRNWRASGSDRSQSQAHHGNAQDVKCYSCGKSGHKSKAPECKATDKTCRNCDKKGHLESVCKAPKRQSTGPQAHNIGVGSLFVTGTECEFEELETIEVTLSTPDGVSIQANALPDTGADISCIAPSTLKLFGLSTMDLQEEHRNPSAANGTALKVLGKIPLTATYRNFFSTEPFFVIENLSRPILSRKCLKRLHLIPQNFPHGVVSATAVSAVESVVRVKTGYPDLDALMARYPRVFDGKCKVMKGKPHHIELEENAKPISSGATRNVAEPYRESLKKELQDLVDQDIIEPVAGASEWLHPIVVVPKKDGGIRMCVDLTKLNKYVKRPVNPQPTPFEVVRKLPKGKKHLAVFDALKGYHQIELDDESRALTTFLTPFGRYRYKRLPFGESDAGDVFTLRYGLAVDSSTEGRRTTEDTLLMGDTESELLHNAEEFFKACDINDITLNTKKIQWNKPEVLFGGFLLNSEGYQIDPALCKALAEFPIPANVTDLRSFCGLANQLCNFSDEIAKLLSPLKSLLKKGIKFAWLPEHQTAFEEARKHLSSSKTLAYYDPSRQTRLICDASRLFGLGFVLKQQVDGIWKTVQAGSRFLSPAETRYAMIELELLAIAWAAKKTAMFIEGLPRSQLEIWTDHQPLVPILERYSLPEIENKRLQRLKMKIMHLQYTVKWVKGTENIEADCLSRAPHAKPKFSDQLDEDEEEDVHIAQIQVNEVCSSELRDERLKELRAFADVNPEYTALASLIRSGFPDKKEDVPEDLQKFFPFREDLYFDVDDFIVYGQKLFVPSELRQTYLKRLLAMHQGAHKMEERAKKSIWWPYISRDIKNVAKTCESCVERAPSNRPEVERHHEPASFPFQFLHMDLAQHGGRYFLITVDQFSGYPNIFECGKTATTRQVTDHLLQLFATFSVPVTIYSDGGPQFMEGENVNRFEFGQFCKEWGVQHVTSSPHYPQSNGLAEEAVKNAKKMITATFDWNTKRCRPAEIAAGLLLFRNTPRSPTNLSPNEIVFGRTVRDNLPISRAHFRPQARYEVEKRLQEVRALRDKQNESGGKTTFELPLLSPGQRVRIQDPVSKRWTSTGTIVSFGSNEREYIVRSDRNDRNYRRNRRFLRPEVVPAKPPPSQPVQAPSLTPGESEPQEVVPSRPSPTPVESALRPALVSSSRPRRNAKLPVRFRD